MPVSQAFIDDIITTTKKWLVTVVIEHNFCPFAKRELQRESIRYVVLEDVPVENWLEELMVECSRLDEDKSIETTLLILPNSLKVFDDYLGFLELANSLMIQEGCEGYYQLASFHPEFCFEGADDSDAANYTNRSPYPMLHLLREEGLEKALENVDAPEMIPERNIALARGLGKAVMQDTLDACFKK